MSNSIYWEVNVLKTQSKIEALIWAKGDLSKIKFYFYDDEWKDKVFTSEPVKSFNELAIQRCIDLRNQADWLTLYLSSGYDSNTVLHYFKLAKKPIDEIFIYKRLTSHDNEYKVACKNAENYRIHHNPRVKITFLPLTKKYLLSVYDKLKSDYIYGPGASLRFSKGAPCWLVNFNETIFRIHDKRNKKNINVIGFEKPRVLVHENKWYSFMPDNAVMDCLDDKLTGFYTDVDAFDLHLKQSYMVIDWFEKFNNFTTEIVHRVQKNDSLYYSAWNAACGRIAIHNDYSINGEGKQLYTNSTCSPDMVELLKNYGDESHLKTYHEGIKKFRHYVDWWDGITDLNASININSKLHFIKDYKNKSIKS
jgi:hypothetical protein